MILKMESKNSRPTDFGAPSSFFKKALIAVNKKKVNHGIKAPTFKRKWRSIGEPVPRV